MNPFLEIPVIITNNENKSKEVRTCIRPGEIEYYYPGFYEDKTVIVMKSGQSFLANMTRGEIDYALELYATHLKKKPGSASILQFVKS